MRLGEISVLLLISLTAVHCAIPRSDLPPAPYPAWAHEHWVWLSNSVQNQTADIVLVDDYLARDIPVGAVDIDSEWSTGINNFIWDTKKYPNASEMVEHFHSLNISVICWITSVVDTDSSNFQYGLDHQYYLNTSRRFFNSGLVEWWHGTGAFIDYTNPDAVDWWHSQMDMVLDIGIDGWKCDGTDPYTFLLYPIEAYSGQIHERQYADMYYGDFFNYTRTKNPNSLIMSRPVDSYDFIYWSFSPHYVMYSGWVGDQDPTFPGLQDALRNMFHSAWRNYANYGSDIGGYRSGNRTRDLFIRWAQLGAFCPLMENGGDGIHEPWLFPSPNETVAIYRNFVDIHYELRDYFFHAGSTAMEEGVSVMYPQATNHFETPDSWNYLLWKDILVCPIIEDSEERTITFPTGSNWISWWDSSEVYQGGSTITQNYTLSSFPVFIKQASLIPLKVSKDLGLGHGDARSAGYTTLLLTHPTEEGGSTAVRLFHGPSQEFWYSMDSSTLSFTATAFGGVMEAEGEYKKYDARPLILLINGVERPRKVLDELKGVAIENEEDIHNRETALWSYDSTERRVSIKPSLSTEGTLLTVHW